MHSSKILALTFCAFAICRAEITPASFESAAIRDASTLETRVLQDWKPAANDPSIRQKLIEITVCEWWAGQKVRLPVTLNAPVSGGPCQNLIVSNVGLSPRAALPTGAMLRLLKQNHVGVVLVGMGTIDAMQPAGKLHLGMKEHLLKTKDARFTPAWIWAISDMRGLTAALTESATFRPFKVLVTGGSKRGIAAAAAAIHDDRVTAILPVVAPALGNPAGPFVSGTEAEHLKQIDRTFLEALAAGKFSNVPMTALTALAEREQRRGNERITLQQARDAGWTKAEIAAINQRAWDVSRVTSHFASLRKRGVEIFYNVGSNDNVTPDLKELGSRFPNFPVYIVPGGQHGGPTTTGFTRQAPYQPEVEDNLYAFALHHFFGSRALVAAPKIHHRWEKKDRVLHIEVTFPDSTEPQKNELWWAVNRHPPGTLPFEYDAWQSVPLRNAGKAAFTGEISIASNATTVDFLTTHTHISNALPLSVSSPYLHLRTD